MSTPLTVTNAARQLGMSPRRVREICEEHSIGVMADGGRLRILRESDLARISSKRRPRGNPNFSARKPKRK